MKYPTDAQIRAVTDQWLNQAARARVQAERTDDLAFAIYLRARAEVLTDCVTILNAVLAGH